MNRTPRMVFLSVLLSALCLAASAVADNNSTADSIPETVRLHDRLNRIGPLPWIRIELDSGEKLEGELERHSDESLSLRLRDGGSRGVSPDSVAAVARKDHSFLAGALVGMGTAGAAFLVIGMPLILLYALMGGIPLVVGGLLIAAGLGAIGGGIVGGAVPHWTNVYDRESPGLGRHGLAGAPVSAQGHAAFLSLQAGYSFSPDENAPDGGPGGVLRLVVPLGRIVASGAEFGLSDLGEKETFREASALVQFSAPIDRIQPYARLGIGWYSFEFDGQRYSGPDAASSFAFSRNGLGGQTTVGVSFFPRRTPFFVNGEVAWHRAWFGEFHVEERGSYGRRLNVLSSAVALSIGW